MELKFLIYQNMSFRQILLIVPYGIEIRVALPLLQPAYLLIVPYGIEISSSSSPLDALKLLIVPYGIEMLNQFISSSTSNPFNRTLWN